ncbi:hypothetical protein LXL04_007351 [Taraxacum kok-saghyz]
MLFLIVDCAKLFQVGGSNLWPKTTNIEPLPPLLRRMPGRPKVYRRKHAYEAQDSKYPTKRAKVPRSNRCGKCKAAGHNKSSCKNVEVPIPTQPQRKSGRPKKDGIDKPIYQVEEYPEVVVAENTKQTSQAEAGKGFIRRTKMKAMSGGKTKCRERGTGPQAQTQESHVDVNVNEGQGLEDVFINIDDLFTNTPFVPYTVPDDDASEGGKGGIHEVDVQYTEHMGMDGLVESEDEDVEAVLQINE